VARRQADSAVSREDIVEGTVAVLTKSGLTDWTVDSVAVKAKCAKGLILYHFRSKEKLLLLAAERVGEKLASSLIGAVRGQRGAQALDRLWEELSKEVGSGAFGLWVTLVGHEPTREVAARVATRDRSLIAAISEALGVPTSSGALAIVPSALTGFGFELLQGRPTDDVRDLFDAFWLGVLSDAE